MIAPLQEFFKTLIAGFGLCFGWRWRGVKPVRPLAHFWAVALIGVLLSMAVQRWQLAGQPARWQAEGILGDGFSTLLLLGAATGALSLARKQYLAFSLASVLIVSQWLIAFACLSLHQLLSTPTSFSIIAQRLTLLSVLWFAFAGWQALRLVLGDAPASKRILLAMAVVLAMLSCWPSIGPLRVQTPRYVVLDQAKLYANEAGLPPPKPAFDAEAVLYRQRSMVEKSLRQLRTGTLGTPDLFVLAVAGDGAEDTFLNEASYAKTLFERRFGTHGRALVLANHPRSTAQFPLASVTNLRATLKGMATHMDLDEDILFLFLASHGGPAPAHEFALNLAPMPLNQLDPKQLAAALADAGIRRRVVVVSACYSGGYLDALSSPDSVIITAASANRTSFGCGGDFELTYFGRAFLLEALNRHKDFLKAFQSAETSIRAREKRESVTASNPQMRIGENAASMLSVWKRSVEVGDAVPFFATDLSP